MSGLRKLTRTHLALLLLVILFGIGIAGVSLVGRAVRSASQSATKASQATTKAAAHPAALARGRTLPTQKPKGKLDSVLEAEPNNSIATATALPLDAMGFATGVGSITAGDEDYWQVSLSSSDDQLYALVETGTTPNADTVLEVRDASGTLIEADDDDGSSTNCSSVLYSERSSTVFAISGSSGTCMGLGPCAFYLRVRAKNATDVIPTYKLMVVGSGVASQPETGEDNSTAATAQPIMGSDEFIASAVGNLNGMDIDYYAIDVGALSAGRVLYLSAGPSDFPVTDDLRLTLIGPDGITPLFSANSSGVGSASDPAAETFCYKLPAAGTYYIRVELVGAPFTGARPQIRNRASALGYRVLAALLPAVAAADLAVTKTGPTTAVAGQNISYTITVQNNGPDDAATLTLTDATPTNTTFQGFTAPAGWSCTPPPMGGTGTLTCTYGDVFALGATASFTFTVQINAGVPNGTMITNTATVSANTFDAVPGNNSGSATTTVGAQTDLALTKTAPATVAPGATFNYSFTLANNGNTATNIVFSDALPAGTVFVSNTTPTGFTCTTPPPNTNGTVTCTRASFPSATSVTFTITVRPNANIPCNTVITNTATATSTTPDANPVNNSSTASSTALTQSDLALTATANRAAAPPDQSVTYTLTVTNNGPSPSASTVVTDQLPAAFTAEAATPSMGACTGVGTNTVTCNLGTLAANGVATIAIRAHVPETCQPTAVANTATVTNSNCGPDPNPANNTATTPTTVQLANLGPGACFPAQSGISGTRPGSVLFAGLFTSGAGASGGSDAQNNTRVNLTNVHPTLRVAVHLFFVDGDTCSIADVFICLTPNQTTSFLMSDMDPGTRGYMMMLAVDGPPGYAGGGNTGCPISFNYLIGNAQIKFTNSPRRDADLESESVPSQFGSPVPTCNPNEPTAVLVFDDSPTGYSRLPAVLALDNIPSRADGNDTVLMLGRIDGDWANGLRPIGNVAGLLFNDTETAFSFGFNISTCFFRSSLSGNLPRTAPRFEQVIPAGRSGWMKIWSADGAALVGAMHNRNDNSRSTPNAFEGGHNLHILRLLPRAVITVPVFPPSCAL